MDIQKYTNTDNWQSLKKFTAARIALGSTGVGIPLKEVLQFRLAHAHARDAVYAQMDQPFLIAGLQQMELVSYILHSKASNRDAYVQQPGMGRQLNGASVQQLQDINTAGDIAFVIADGLSATAINNHAIPLLRLLKPLLMQAGFSVTPACLVQQARVAIADEVATLLQARCTILLIGERPGLSSPDSMGVYITYQPRIGFTDESRNCISNIRPAGMNYSLAAEKIHYLVNEMFRVQYSGVALKDHTGLLGNK